MSYFYSGFFSPRNEVEGNKKERDEIETLNIFNFFFERKNRKKKRSYFHVEPPTTPPN